MKLIMTKSQLNRFKKRADRYAGYDSVYPGDNEILRIGKDSCPEWAQMGHLEIQGVIYSFSKEKSGRFSVVRRDDLETADEIADCFREAV